MLAGRRVTLAGVSLSLRILLALSPFVPGNIVLSQIKHTREIHYDLNNQAQEKDVSKDS